jgi:MoaA/NifB/PqqE/SkfB family radical SAM enzyme
MIEKNIKKYELEITANCNAECPLCARTEMGLPLRGNKEITLENIKHIFPTSESCDGKEFKLCGVLGDPIINSECLEICEYLSSQGGNINMSTNGGYQNEEWWTKLAKIKNLYVDFSVDGFKDTNHIYRVNVNWSTLERNMRAYMGAGGKANWVFIPFDHNEDDYEKAKSLAQELGMKFIRRTSGRNEFNKDRKHKPRKAEEVKLNNSKKLPHNDLDKLKEIYTSKDPKVVDEIVHTLSCQHYEEPEAFVASDMTLWPCCFLYGDSIHMYEQITQTTDRDFNNLSKHSISDILQTEFYQSLKSRWYASHPAHLRKCIRACGLKGIYKNKKVHDTN